MVAARKSTPAVPEPRPKTAPGRDAQLHVSRGGKSQPRLPHELDQSSDQQRVGNAAARSQGRRAADALARGHEDTGQAPVLERLARQNFKPSPGPRRRRG
jgi:hypothetical protein